MLIPNEQLGSVEIISTLAGDKVSAQYAVVDIASLVASNHLNGAINESYPQGLQPRDRTTAKSVNKLERFSHNIEFSRLNASKKTDVGAPIIGDDMAVESGNGRVIALTKAYYEGHASEYRYQLYSLASRFGLQSAVVESLKRPMLVRLRLTDVNRAKFAKDSNADQEESQNKNLAPNGRMFEAIDTSALSAKGRGLVAFDYCFDGAEIKQMILTYGGKAALKASDDPYSLYVGVFADRLRGYLRQPDIPAGRAMVMAKPAVMANEETASYDLDSDPVLAAAIADGLGLATPLDYGEFKELVDSLELLKLDGLSKANELITKVLLGNAHPLAHKNLAANLMPFEMLAGGDKDLMAAILTKVLARTVTASNVSELFDAPEFDNDLMNQHKELFTDDTKAVIDSFYSDIPNSVDTSAVMAHFESLIHRSVAHVKANLSDPSEIPLVLEGQAAVWGRYSNVYNNTIKIHNASRNKAKRAKLLEVVRGYDKKFENSKSPEVTAYVLAIEGYKDKGVMPKAGVVGLNTLSRLKEAEMMAKSEQSGEAVERVVDYIDGVIAQNASVEQYKPSINSRSLKGAITRINKKKPNSIESLDSVMSYSNAMNRLVGGNLPQDMRFTHKDMRAHYSELGGDKHEVNIGTGTLTTMWHELGHSLEVKYPIIKDLAKDLVLKRYEEAKDPKVAQLNKITEYGHVKDTEIFVDNYTFSPYAMRIYPRSSPKVEYINTYVIMSLKNTEIVSMAFEMLATKKGVAKLMTDKDHFSIAMAAVEYLKTKRD